MLFIFILFEAGIQKSSEKITTVSDLAQWQYNNPHTAVNGANPHRFTRFEVRIQVCFLLLCSQKQIDCNKVKIVFFEPRLNGASKWSTLSAASEKAGGNKRERNGKKERQNWMNGQRTQKTQKAKWKLWRYRKNRQKEKNLLQILFLQPVTDVSFDMISIGGDNN